MISSLLFAFWMVQAASPTIDGRIERIHIEGNRDLSDGQIRDALKTLREGASVRLAGAEDPKVQDDITRIRILLAERGYARGNVLPVEIKPIVSTGPARGNRYEVFITVQENDRYRVGEITITGNTFQKESDIRRALDLRSGAIFNDTQIRNGLVRLKETYGRFGYINFSPNRDHLFDDARKLVHLNIDIDEGKQYRIGAIRVVGNELFSEARVRRELRVREGAIFNGLDLTNSLDAIRKLYGKRGDVDALVIFDKSSPLTVNLTIQIKETPGPVAAAAVRARPYRAPGSIESAV